MNIPDSSLITLKLSSIGYRILVTPTARFPLLLPLSQPSLNQESDKVDNSKENEVPAVYQSHLGHSLEIIITIS
jgi:hypothetical protein